MIGEVVDRLVARCPALAAVMPAEDLDAIEKGTAVRDGTALVIPFRERAAPNSRASGGHLQRVNAQVFVVLVLRRHDDAKGGRRAGRFDLYKRQIEAALAGWSPDPAMVDPYELVGGEGQPLGNGVSVYVQTWETTRSLIGETT